VNSTLFKESTCRLSCPKQVEFCSLRSLSLSFSERENPLAIPHSRELLAEFTRRFNVVTRQHSSKEQLIQIAQAFSTLPYENLTKIIKRSETGIVGSSRRGPSEVLHDHYTLGTGGTCFSLTATLLHLVRALGFQAEPLLADRSYGDNTHCALLVWIDDRPHLIDPGFLIVDPIPVGSKETIHVQTSFNDLVLVPAMQGEQLELHTVSCGRQKHRLTFKTSPVDAGQFLKAWDASFDWDMMRYALVTSISEGEQRYLRGRFFQRRSRKELQTDNLNPESLAQAIENQFGISSRVITLALDVLKRQGENLL
jgi:arylamine N-acetyltransferase